MADNNNNDNHDLNPPEAGASSPTQPIQPVPTPRLIEIAAEACDSIFSSVTSYDHSQTKEWNTKIINTVLQSLIKATSKPADRHPYKFAVTSTIIQHTALTTQESGSNEGYPNDPSSTLGSEPTKTSAGKRGMHSATGAFWDNVRDGTWSYKYEKEGKGFDAVVSIIWIAAAAG